MASLPNFAFYKGVYFGISIPYIDWARLAMRADEQIAYFEHRFSLTGDEKSRNKALCAIADAIYAAEVVSSQMAQADNVSSVSIGSVSTSFKSPGIDSLGLDLTEDGQTRLYYKILQKYLKVYRGVGSCR